MSALFRKKPMPVEARQVPPSSDGKSGLDLAAWCGGSVSGTYAEPKIFVPTLEGDLAARVGDWIVKGPRGEFWPVKGSIFAETYEPVDGAVPPLDARREDVLAEVVTWLIKKAREYPRRNKLGRTQADTAASLASQIRRGAVRPNNLQMLPATFFEPGRTYRREHHGDTIDFLVEYISTSPDGRLTVAHGWRNRSWDPGWEPSDSDDFTGWADITEAGDAG
ncbi:hypothetical protein ACKI14_02280 [Streptomyces turgidiscabies]|uniref:hypothetical protein n=1 Tax=Streptomyces turgidiscabies TaxID=85558 RepID=UPI0038F63945